MQKRVKKIIEEVCKKHGVPAHIGQKVFNIPYRILKEQTSKSYGSFEESDYPIVMIPMLGKFYTPQNRLDDVKKYLEKKKLEQQQNENNED